MDEAKFLSIIGLCRKAGKLVLGADCTCDAVRSGRSRLAVIASDASDNTKKKVQNCASYYKKRVCVCETGKKRLGECLGRKGEVSCLAVCDDGFYTLIEKHIAPEKVQNQ